MASHTGPCKMWRLQGLLVVGLFAAIVTVSCEDAAERAGKQFMQQLDMEAAQRCILRNLKEWNYASNMTKENKAEATKASIEYMNFWKRMWDEGRQHAWKNFENAELRRQFKFISVIGMSLLPEEKVKKYNNAKQSMEEIYSTARICSFKDKGKCDLTLEPEITEVMMNSRNESELRDAWLQWRKLSGKKMRKFYPDLATIIKDVATANNFSYASEYDTEAYDSPTFQADVDRLWDQLRPFYSELHAYVRRKLRESYGPVVSDLGPIPAHLLGDMWGQSWTNVFDLVIPFKAKTSIDVTPKMIESGMTPRGMAGIAEDFFVSLGFPRLPPEFWNGSILEKPKDRQIVCHASAWDLCDGKNFRIKQCTRVNMLDLITLHHEMGHTMYQIQYKNLHKLFRDGANPGFHEAIGDLIALSVQTPAHLHKIGLLESIEDDGEADLNYLLSMALEKIAFLPFGLLVDKWRWGVFDGVIGPEDYNCAWWKLRLNYQGLSPPEPRTEADFDPGAKYHVAVNSNYVRYFVSTVVQFQFHKGLCITANQYDAQNAGARPLHKCDIYGSKEAGRKLMDMLKLGSSKPWPDAMELITGGRIMDAGPIVEYFQPLMTWLREDNRKHNVTVGWKEEKPLCVNKMQKKISSRAGQIKSITGWLILGLPLISTYL